MTLISSEGMKGLKTHAERRERIKELLAKYPDPWVIDKEPHNYNDGTKEFTRVRYHSKKIVGTVSIGEYVTPELAELLILLREHALETV